MEKIIFVSSDVVAFLKQLVWTLYSEEYFGFEESAHEYVEKLRKTIYNDLPGLIHYETPQELRKYGRYYVKLKSNKRTMWYVFFDKYENRYLVEFITNNHAPQSEYLNAL
jgi:hypothetical protein